MNNSNVDQVCLNCGGVFSARKADVKRGRAKFCCQSCGTVYSNKNKPKKLLSCACAWCQTPLLRKAHKTSKSGLYFCSIEHQGLFKRQENGHSEIWPEHYTGQASSYREVAFRVQDNKCAVCGYCEHKEVLHVHHIDHDRSNNAVSNLQILCPNCHEEHHYLTGTGRYGGKRK